MLADLTSEVRNGIGTDAPVVMAARAKSRAKTMSFLHKDVLSAISKAKTAFVAERKAVTAQRNRKSAEAMAALTEATQRAQESVKNSYHTFSQRFPEEIETLIDIRLAAAVAEVVLETAGSASGSESTSGPAPASG